MTKWDYYFLIVIFLVLYAYFSSVLNLYNDVLALMVFKMCFHDVCVKFISYLGGPHEGRKVGTQIL